MILLLQTKSHVTLLHAFDVDPLLAGLDVADHLQHLVDVRRLLVEQVLQVLHPLDKPERFSLADCDRQW